MSKVSLNLTLLAAHLALVAAATGLALLITQLALHPPLSDLALLAALMTLLGLAATLFGHLAISLAPHLRFASLQARTGGATVLGSILALASIRVSTYAIYEVSLRKHIIPEIGHLKLARLTADDLDGLYSRLLSGGLSPKTVRMIHAVLHRALSHAQRRGAIAVNPASVAAPPSAPRREFRTLAPAEAALLLKAALSDRLYGVYVLALTCGLRQGEILGLRWADVDLNGAVLHVRQQVYRMAGEWVFSEPKTAAGRRTVSLSGSAVEALRERRLAQNKERLRAETWEDLDLVFSNRRGNPIDKANLLRGSFWPLLERAGLPHMRFHDLRHSCASLLLAEGVHPKVVQEMLGHSSISVTLDIYSHVLPSMQADAAEKMDRLLAASN